MFKGVASIIRENGFISVLAANQVGILVAVAFNAASIIPVVLAILGIITTLVGILSASQKSRSDEQTTRNEGQRILNRLAEQNIDTQADNILLNAEIREMQLRIIVLGRRNGESEKVVEEIKHELDKNPAIDIT